MRNVDWSTVRNVQRLAAAILLVPLLITAYYIGLMSQLTWNDLALSFKLMLGCCTVVSLFLLSCSFSTSRRIVVWSCLFASASLVVGGIALVQQGVLRDLLEWKLAPPFVILLVMAGFGEFACLTFVVFCSQVRGRNDVGGA